jgi:hypothetical protein
MVRKAASLLLGLALFVALGFALAHVQTLKAPATSEFSAPCESAPPSFKAAGEAKVVSSLDWCFGADTAQAPGGIARRWRAEAAISPTPGSAPRAFPPLFRRPPPVVS